jgi:hypothetical protein
LTFLSYGRMTASLNPTLKTLSANGIDSSDNSLRTLQEAGNPGAIRNYTIYSAYLHYDTGATGAILVCCTPTDYEL